ncbi:hypothetical protein FHL15_001820 [Xylaria flabelliformis]|uniref:Uncharacterized protein n=1 Tax=Xylaria flabelliformis TaxID=2512241 RepID=A0A553IBH1_9PEZI|nr:hypothetical protein FHL15_001820 [Xylaria flabelliformis]
MGTDLAHQSTPQMHGAGDDDVARAAGPQYTHVPTWRALLRIRRQHRACWPATKFLVKPLLVRSFLVAAHRSLATYLAAILGQSLRELSHSYLILTPNLILGDQVRMQVQESVRCKEHADRDMKQTNQPNRVELSARTILSPILLTQDNENATKATFPCAVGGDALVIHSALEV